MSKGERVTPAYIRFIITLLAGLLTIVLTAVAFWLSYEHLHDVAGDHGLSGERAWAWPATLDMFIVIGELLILRASLMQKVDPWSWVCASIGSVGSITLNVVGVGKDAGSLDYVIAAVPPVAALLAFGILMRQLHEAITAYVNAPPKIVPGDRTVPPGVATFDGESDIIGIDLAPSISGLITGDITQEEMDEAGRRLLHAVTHPEEDDEEDEIDYLPDAMRYQPGDEDAVAQAPGQDASIDFLRRAANHIHHTVMDNPTTEQLSEILSTVPPAPVNPPSSFVPRTSMVIHSPGGYRADLEILDEAFTGGHGDMYTAPVGTEEPVSPALSPGEAWRRLHPEYVLPGDVPGDTGTEDTRTEDGGHPPEDTQEDVPVPVSRPVPRPRPTGAKPSAPGRVRDILGEVPGTTDEELRDILKGEEFVPNTINKAIKRVRKEMGT